MVFYLFGSMARGGGGCITTMCRDSFECSGRSLPCFPARYDSPRAMVPATEFLPACGARMLRYLHLCTETELRDRRSFPSGSIVALLSVQSVNRSRGVGSDLLGSGRFVLVFAPARFKPGV